MLDTEEQRRLEAESECFRSAPERSEEQEQVCFREMNNVEQVSDELLIRRARLKQDGVSQNYKDRSDQEAEGTAEGIRSNDGEWQEASDGREPPNLDEDLIVLQEAIVKKDIAKVRELTRLHGYGILVQPNRFGNAAMRLAMDHSTKEIQQYIFEAIRENSHYRNKVRGH
jgi:hypothetical protein